MANRTQSDYGDRRKELPRTTRPRTSGHRRRLPRGVADRRKWLAWWLAAGLPVIVAGLLVASEDVGLPDLTPRYDLSWTLVSVLGMFTAIAGVAMAIAAIRRARAALNSAQQRLTRGARHGVLWEAYGIRRRNAWLVAVGATLAIIGGLVTWLAMSRI